MPGLHAFGLVGLRWLTVRLTSESDQIAGVARRIKKDNGRNDRDLFNDLIGHCENLRRHIEAERFRGLKIDHQFDLGCLHHR
jgi:hypothetical protein